MLCRIGLVLSAKPELLLSQAARISSGCGGMNLPDEQTM
jgi:hypothetical protein